MKDLPPHTEKQILRFFMDHKTLEGKEVINKVEKFLGREEALKIVEEAIELYQSTFVDQVTKG